MGPIALEEPILPLDHHPEVLVVEQQHLDWDVFRPAGGKLLNVHQDAAVAVDVDNERPGAGHLGSHRCRQPEAHRAQPARREPGPRPAKLEKLGRPHLVLTHAHGHDCVAVGREPGEFGDRVLRQDAREFGVVGERILPLPLSDPGAPLGERGSRLLHDLIESVQRVLDVGHDRHVNDLVLVDLGGVDVDVNDESMLGELAHLPRDPVVEADADGDQQVGLIHGVVGIDAAVHPEHVEAEWIIGRKCSQTHERHRDGDAGLADELPQLVGGVAGDHAAAGIDNRPLGPLDGRGHLGDLLGPGGRRFGAIAGEVEGDVVVGYHVCELDVFRQVDEDGPRTAGDGDVKGLPHHAGDVIGVGHEVVVFCDRAADLDDRRLLEGVGADYARAHLPGDRDQGHTIHLGVSDGGNEVQGPRAAGRHADTRLAGDTAVALGREAPPLLVAGEDCADPVCVPRERLVERHARPAGIGEDHVYALADERLDDHIGPRNKGGGGGWSGDGGHGGTPGRNKTGHEQDSSKIHESCGIAKKDRQPYFGPRSLPK